MANSLERETGVIRGLLPEKVVLARKPLDALGQAGVAQTKVLRQVGVHN